MKKIVLVCAFMLIGSYSFANRGVNLDPNVIITSSVQTLTFDSEKC